MGAGQSDAFELEGATESHCLAAGSQATREQLVEALARMERNAGVAQLREIFLVESSRIDQLLAFVKSLPFETIKASGGRKMNRHGHYGIGDSLRVPALKVLIELTSSNVRDRPASSPPGKPSHLFESVSNAENEKGLDASHSTESSSLWFSCAQGRSAPTTEVRLDDPAKSATAENMKPSSAAVTEVHEQQRIRRYLINFIGGAKTMQYLLLLAMTKEPPEVGGLAVELLANLVDGGDDHVRRTLASMPLHPLVYHARTHSMLLHGETKIATDRSATAAFVAIGHMLEHALSHRDRQRGRDDSTGEQFRTEKEKQEASRMLVSIHEIAKWTKGNASEDSADASENDNDDNKKRDYLDGPGNHVAIAEKERSESNSAPFSDVFELRMHRRFMNMGLISAIGKQISFGIPSSRMLNLMIHCIFNLVSGKNLLIMETDMNAIKCVDNLRSDVLQSHVPLEYSEDLDYSLLVASTLLERTTVLDFLMWCISIDVHVPTWASNLNNPNTRLPYPWNICRAVADCPSIRTNAMAALSALAAGMNNFQELLSRSLVVPTASKYLTDFDNISVSSSSCSDYSSSEHSSGSDSSASDSDGSNEDDEDRLSDEFGSTSDADDDDLRFLQNGLIKSFVLEKGTELEQSHKKIQRKRTRRVWHFKRYSLKAISGLLETMDKSTMEGSSDLRVTKVLTQGIRKKWHLRVIEKAIRCRRSVKADEDVRLSSAGLIASIRKLAHRDRMKVQRMLRAQRALNESTFGRIRKTHSAELKSIAMESGRISHLSIKSAVQTGASRWRALHHSIVKTSRLNSDQFRTDTFRERIYFTVSTYKNPHDLWPLWELLPPESLLKSLGIKSSYTIVFDRMATKGLGVAFTKSEDTSSGHGVAVSSIISGTQADRARLAGLAVGDIVLSVNGKNVRGAKWTAKRVEQIIEQSQNPLRITFFSQKARQYLATLHNKCATRRWFEGCNDSIWVEPAESLFRVVRVLVKHREDIEAPDLVNGSTVRLLEGSGLLNDILAPLDDAYIVSVSDVTEYPVYNRCSLVYNKFRIYKRLEKTAIQNVIDAVIRDMFDRGFANDIRRRDRSEILQSIDKRRSRLGVVFRCLVTTFTAEGDKIPDLARYHAVCVILKLFASSWRAHERSQSLSILDLLNDLGSEAIVKSNREKTHHGVSEKEMTNFFICAIEDPIVGIRGYTTVMHLADLFQKIASSAMKFPPVLALRIAKLIVPATTHALKNFKNLDQPSCRRFLFAIESLSYRSESECGSLLVKSGCYRHIFKIAKSYNTYTQPKTLEAALFAIAAGCLYDTVNIYLKRKLGLLSYLKRNELNFLESSGDRKKHIAKAILLARSNLIKPPTVIKDGADFKSILDKLAKIIINTEMKSKKGANGAGNVGDNDKITFADNFEDKAPRLKNQKNRAAVGLFRRSSLSRCIALGALARLSGHLTRGRNICKEIAKTHVLTQSVVKAAQTHHISFGTFGSTLGQLQALQILVNMCQKPSGVHLWLQFSEEHKLGMDHSGTVVSTLRHSSIPPPTDENHVQYLTHGVTKCAKCCKPYLNPRDRSLLQTFEYERSGQWQYVPRFHKRNSVAYHKNVVLAHSSRAKRTKSNPNDEITHPILERKRFGAAWLCPMCYADDMTDPTNLHGGRDFGRCFKGVPGTQPSWIYREEQFEKREEAHGLPTRDELGKRRMRLQNMERKLTSAQEMRLESIEINEIRENLDKLSLSQRKQSEKEQRLRDKSDAVPFPLGTFVKLFIAPEDTSFSKLALFNGQRAIIMGIVHAHRVSKQRREKFSDSFWYEIAIERHLLSDDSRKQSKRYEVKMGHVFYTERRLMPPIRWGAKFGGKSVVIIPGTGLKIPSGGWTISVWFRGGSWIRRLRSKLHFLTLCESSDGSKLIALDQDMQLGSFSTAHEENDHNPTWHCCEESMLKLPEILHQALGTKREDFLRDEPGHWLRLVVVAHRGQRSNQNMSFWLGCASQDRMDVEMFRMATISGFFPHASDIKYVGNSKDGYQQWGAISDFRLYGYAFDTSKPELWPGCWVPPVDSERLKDIQSESGTGTSLSAPKINQITMLLNEADVLNTQYEVVKAGAMTCLSALVQNSTHVPMQRLAMRTIALIASNISLRQNVIEMKGLVDRILELCHSLDPELALWSIRAVAALR